MITSDARCKCGIKTGIAIPKAALNKKKALVTSRFVIPPLKEEPSKVLAADGA
jgi:hypothetical protein